ncbi:MAG: hypothetical protein IPK97_07620 [Ahniella sp.]|nr:hypothetical protein [Ahniella sp.]
MKEVQTNLTQAKQDIVAFIESGWQHERAEQIPRLIEEISGAMRMINLDQAGASLDAIGRFIDVEVLQRKRVPNSDQVDRLADAVASIEYYLRRPAPSVMDAKRSWKSLAKVWKHWATGRFRRAMRTVPLLRSRLVDYTCCGSGCRSRSDRCALCLRVRGQRQNLCPNCPLPST